MSIAPTGSRTSGLADLLSNALGNDGNPLEQLLEQLLDSSQNQATSDVDPSDNSASSPDTQQCTGADQFGTPDALQMLTDLLNSLSNQPGNSDPNQLGSADASNSQPLLPDGGDDGAQSCAADDDGCGTLARFPPHPPGNWGDVVNAALSFTG